MTDRPAVSVEAIERFAEHGEPTNVDRPKWRRALADLALSARETEAELKEMYLALSERIKERDAMRESAKEMEALLAIYKAEDVESAEELAEAVEMIDAMREAIKRAVESLKLSDNQGDVLDVCADLENAIKEQSLNPKNEEGKERNGEKEPAIKPTHEAADAFWKYWKANGETNRHGYYESTWGAINAALRTSGVILHKYGSTLREMLEDQDHE